MPQAVPYIIAAAAVGSTAVSVQQASEQRDVNRDRQRQADAQANAERRRIVRESRIRRAQVLNASAQVGGQDSSGETAATGSIANQTATNLGESFSFQNNSRRQSRGLQNIADLQTTGNLFSTLGRTAGMFQ